MNTTSGCHVLLVSGRMTRPCHGSQGSSHHQISGRAVPQVASSYLFRNDIVNGDPSPQGDDSELTVNYKDLLATSSHARNIVEEYVVLSENHHGLIIARKWRLFNVHPFEWSAIGNLQETHVQVV